MQARVVGVLALLGSSGGANAAEPLSIPHGRAASGTAWQPDAAPHAAWHLHAGDWHLMGMAQLFAQYVDEGGARGDEDFGAQGMVMGHASHALLGGDVELRAMLSPDPLTLGECGYPNTLQTGERCDGLGDLHDRQHPHDLLSELALGWKGALSESVGAQIYGGVAGEPALGPVAFPHRLSAQLNPVAPIGHHWFDSTHVSFGVATLGVYGYAWKVEGSAFNGREPDEERLDLDLDTFDSYSARIWVLPSDEWAIQVSAGQLTDDRRYTASATWHCDGWDVTGGWARDGDEDALLLEGSLSDGGHVVFGRVERVEKSGADLAAGEADTIYGVAKSQFGYVREVTAGESRVGVGFSAWAARVSEGLVAAYGEDSPVGLAIFATLRP